jgi:hypothetical protein
MKRFVHDMVTIALGATAFTAILALLQLIVHGHINW